MQYRSPANELEFQMYLQLRWEILRKPWDPGNGPQKEDDDDRSFHMMAIENDTVAGVGRIHLRDDGRMQVRFMAVAPEYTKRNIGSEILKRLEAHAIEKQAAVVELNSRESAIPFYKKNGYTTVEKGFLLWDSIQHYVMEKQLAHKKTPQPSIR